MSDFNPERWRRNYEADMARAESTYRDVLDALHACEIPASMEQTGGMCLAIQWETGGGYYLLTDLEGPLPWNREHLTGWAFGRYDAEGDAIGECATTDDATSGGAVRLVLATITG